MIKMLVHETDHAIGHLLLRRLSLRNPELTCQHHDQCQRHRLQDILRIRPLIRIFNCHEFNLRPYGTVIYIRKMDELIGKAVNLRIKEKMQQPVVSGYGPEKVPVKDLLFYQDSDDHDILFPGSVKGIARERLTDITFVLAYDHVIVKAVTLGSVIPMVGIVDEEEILTMKFLMDFPALENADHDIFIRFSEPLGNQFFFPTDPVFLKVPVQIRKISTQLVDCLNDSVFHADFLSDICSERPPFDIKPGLSELLCERRFLSEGQEDGCIEKLTNRGLQIIMDSFYCFDRICITPMIQYLYIREACAFEAMYLMFNSKWRIVMIEGTVINALLGF